MEREAAILVAMVAGTLGCATATSYRGYTPKDRAGMAFVVKTKSGAYKVVGGPKNHVAQPSERITCVSALTTATLVLGRSDRW